jgi:hypothetical protein
MKRSRVENAVNIINFAIKNQMSVKEASVKCGFSDTYVKNVKADINSKLEKNSELYRLFNDSYQEYSRFMGILHDNDEIADESSKLIIKTNKPNDLPTISDGEKLNVDIGNREVNVEWVSGLNYPADHVKTLDELLAATKVNLKVWNVKDYTVNKWDVTAVIDKMPRTFQNWQVKARLERNELNFKELEIGEMFIDMIKNYQPPVLDWTPEVPQKHEDNNLLEVSIFDLHIGKLAWGGETYENYDTKIARERFLYAIETLLQRASGFKYSRILFPVGSDFFNSDTIYNTTTKGTQQDEDLRWQKTFDIGCRLLIDAINMLKQTGVPVDVINIPGNHDFERSFYMGKFLSAWFNNDPQVSVDTHASPRKYYHFGNVLLGLTHGSEEKESALPMIMATDIPSKPLWSETKFHEWHVGHIHRKRNVSYKVTDNKERTLNEDLGVTVRYLSSLTGTEEWHHKKGFIGCTKAADAFIWNFEFGLVAHLNTNLTIE